MKTCLLAAFLSLFSLQACGQPSDPPASMVATPTTTGSPQTDVAAPAYRLVEGIIANPKILERPWSEMRKVFPVGCQKKGDDPDLICPPMAGVVELSASDGGLGIIDVVFSDPPVTCERVRAVISKRFGPGKSWKGNGCAAEWSLGGRVKHGYIDLRPNPQDPTKIIFQMAVEQGP